MSEAVFEFAVASCIIFGVFAVLTYFADKVEDK